MLSVIKDFIGKAETLRVGENFIFLSLLQALNYVLPLITFPYLVRVLGIEKFGLVSFANSFITYFQIITDYGFALSAPREIATNREDQHKIEEIYWSIIFIKGGLLTISFLFFVIIVILFERFRGDWMLYFLTFGMVVGNALFPIWFYQGIERMKFITFLSFFSKVLFTVSLFLLVKSSKDYYMVPLLNSMSYVFIGILALWLNYVYFGIRFCIPSKSQIFDSLKQGWYVFISTIVINLYTSSRIFIVGIFTNNYITGNYAIAEKLMNVFQTFPLLSLLQAAYPRLSAIYQYSPLRALELMKKLQKWTTITYLFIAFLLILSAEKVLSIIAGEIYREAIFALRILAIAIFFTNANSFRVQFLLISGNHKLFANIHLILGLLGFAIMLLLGYRFGYIGVAFSIVIISIVVLWSTYQIVKGFTYFY